jgi:hypothetical protein
MNQNLLNFIGSVLILGIAISIFFTLMSTDMPQGNREILISFVSVLFGGMALSIKNIIGSKDKD